MDELSVKIYPSDLSRDEKEHKLWEVLEFLLHPEKNEGSDKMQAAGKVENMTNIPPKEKTMNVINLDDTSADAF